MPGSASNHCRGCSVIFTKIYGPNQGKLSSNLLQFATRPDLSVANNSLGPEYKPRSDNIEGTPVAYTIFRIYPEIFLRSV